MKNKGFVLSLDAIIALIFIISLMAAITSLYFFKKSDTSVAEFEMEHYISEDALEVMNKKSLLDESSLRVGELSEDALDLTVLDKIGRYWAGCLDFDTRIYISELNSGKSISVCNRNTNADVSKAECNANGTACNITTCHTEKCSIVSCLINSTSNNFSIDDYGKSYFDDASELSNITLNSTYRIYNCSVSLNLTDYGQTASGIAKFYLTPILNYPSVGFRLKLDNDMIYEDLKIPEDKAKTKSASKRILVGYTQGSMVIGCSARAQIVAVKKALTCKTIPIEQEGSGWSTVGGSAKVTNRTYIYPFFSIGDAYSSKIGTAIQITAFEDGTMYALESYNPLTDSWETAITNGNPPANVSLNKGDLQIYDNVINQPNCPGVPKYNTAYRVRSNKEVGINVMSTSGSTLSALSTNMTYAGTEFIFAGTVRCQWECGTPACSNKKTRISGYAIENGTSVKVEYCSKGASTEPTGFNINSFSSASCEQYAVIGNYNLNADSMFDTGEYNLPTLKGPDRHTVIKVTSNKPIITFRTSFGISDPDFAISYDSENGGPYGKNLVYVGKCKTGESNPLIFYIYNRGSGEAKVDIKAWNGTSWELIKKEISVLNAGVAVYENNTCYDFWKFSIRQDSPSKEISVIAGSKNCITTDVPCSDGLEAYWEIPSTDKEWQNFIVNVIYGGKIDNKGNVNIRTAFQEFVPTIGDTQITVSPTISGELYYLCSGNVSIFDGVSTDLICDFNQRSIMVSNLELFDLKMESVLLWAINTSSNPLNKNISSTSKTWTFTGTKAFRFYQGGLRYCLGVGIIPMKFEEGVPFIGETGGEYKPPLRGGDLNIIHKFSMPEDAVLNSSKLYVCMHEGYGNTTNYSEVKINGAKVWSNNIVGGYVEEKFINFIPQKENTIEVYMKKPQYYHAHIHPGFRLETCYSTSTSEIEWEGNKIVKTYNLDNVLGHPTAWTSITFEIPEGATGIEISGYAHVRGVNTYLESGLSNIKYPNYVLSNTTLTTNCSSNSSSEYQKEREIFINNPGVPDSPGIPNIDISLSPSDLSTGYSNTIYLYVDTKNTEDTAVKCYDPKTNETNPEWAEIVEGNITIKYIPSNLKYGDITLTTILPAVSGINNAVYLNYTIPQKTNIIGGTAHYTGLYSWMVNYFSNSNLTYRSPDGRIVPTSVYIPSSSLHPGLNSMNMSDINENNTAYSGSVEYTQTVSRSVQYGKPDYCSDSRGSTVVLWQDYNRDGTAETNSTIPVGDDPADIFNPYIDTIDDALVRLLDGLNFYNDTNPEIAVPLDNIEGNQSEDCRCCTSESKPCTPSCLPYCGDGSVKNPIDIEITEEVTIIIVSGGNIRSLWGPAVVKLEVWM